MYYNIYIYTLQCYKLISIITRTQNNKQSSFHLRVGVGQLGRGVGEGVRGAVVAP
jgi:hypothetical protein